MNRREHLLSILAEEAVEVAQRATKSLRFGLVEIQEGQGLTNAERLWHEIVDLEAMVRMLVAEGFLRLPDPTARQEAIDAKQAKVEKYLAYSGACGTLND